MRAPIRLAVSTLVALALAPSLSTLSTLDAQEGNTFGAGVSGPSGSTSTSGRLNVEEIRIVASWIDDADRYTMVGRLQDARRLLREVLVIQRRGGAYTAPTLRRLANVEFALDRPLVAARVLEDAAFAANSMSDPQTELEALVDAMILYGQEGRREKVSALRPRMQRLLESPAIPEALRQKWARHLITE